MSDPSKWPFWHILAAWYEARVELDAANEDVDEDVDTRNLRRRVEDLEADLESAIACARKACDVPAVPVRGIMTRPQWRRALIEAMRKCFGGQAP